MPPEKDVFADAQLWNEHEFLMNDVDAEIVRLVRGFDLDWLALPEDLPPVCFIQPGDDLHERGLSGAVFADQSMNLSGPNVEGDVIKHDNTTKRLRYVLHAEEQARISRQYLWCLPVKRVFSIFHFSFLICRRL